MWKNRNWGWPTGSRVICSFHKEYDFDIKTPFVAQEVRCILRTVPAAKKKNEAGKLAKRKNGRN